MIKSFGYSAGISATTIGNRLVATYYNITENGRAVRIRAGVYVTSGVGKIKAAIYSYVGATDAGILLSESDEVSVTENTKTWKTFTLKNPVMLTANTNYFLAIFGNTGCFLGSSVGGNTVYVNKTYDGVFPNPFSNETINNISQDILCDYVPMDSPLYGNIRIYYSGNSYIPCWCKRWDEGNWDVTLEVFLDPGYRDTLFSYVTPGAVSELYNILGTPRYLDTTYSSGNTLRIEPQYGYGISGIRKKRKIGVKNISDITINPKYLTTKIEGYRLDI